MVTNSKLDEAIQSISDLISDYEKKLNYCRNFIKILKSEKKFNEKSGDGPNLVLNAKEEIREAIIGFFNDENANGSLSQIEGYLKDKGYKGYSKKGLSHSIGTMLNRDPIFIRTKDSKYCRLREYSMLQEE